MIEGEARVWDALSRLLATDLQEQDVNSVVYRVGSQIMSRAESNTTHCDCKETTGQFV